MTQLQLYLAQIPPLVGERVATAVPQLVRVNQRQLALQPDATKHPAKPVNIDSDLRPSRLDRIWD